MTKEHTRPPVPDGAQTPFRTFVRVGEEDPLPSLLSGDPYAAVEAHRADLSRRLPRSWMNALNKAPTPLIVVTYLTAATWLLRVTEWGFAASTVLLLALYYTAIRSLRGRATHLEFDPDAQQRIRRSLRQSSGELMATDVQTAIDEVMSEIGRTQPHHPSYPDVAVLAGAWRGHTERLLQTLAHELDEHPPHPNAAQTHEAVREAFRKLLAIKRHLADRSVPLPEPPRGFAASSTEANEDLVPIARRASACGDPDCGS